MDCRPPRRDLRTATPLRAHARPQAISSDILQIPSSTSFIYRILYKILFSISHFSPTTFSKSRSLYIKPYIRNVFCSKFLYVRIYHTSNAMDIFYFYLIQCLKRKEKIEKRRENLYIQRKPVGFSILEDHLENAAGAIENGNAAGDSLGRTPPPHPPVEHPAHRLAASLQACRRRRRVAWPPSPTSLPHFVAFASTPRLRPRNSLFDPVWFG
jgi:hypothetical protein